MTDRRIRRPVALAAVAAASLLVLVPVMAAPTEAPAASEAASSPSVGGTGGDSPASLMLPVTPGAEPTGPLTPSSPARPGRPEATTSTVAPTTTSTGVAPTTTTSTVAPATTTSTVAPATTTSTVAPPSTTSTTVAPATTTSTTAPPTTAAGPVVWSADHESGRLLDHYLQFDVSGEATAVSTTEVAHRGSRSMALTIYDADGQGPSPGVRAVVQPQLGPTDAENLPDAFYSAWYFFPHTIENTWWNVFQWKQEVVLPGGGLTHQLLYFVLLEDNADGTMTYTLRSAVDASGLPTSNHFTVQSSTMPVPIGAWTQLECYYRWSKQAAGEISCWQDGRKIFARTGLHTELDQPFRYRPRVWTLNNYADDTTPSTHTIYVDDAAISLTRQGPG